MDEDSNEVSMAFEYTFKQNGIMNKNIWIDKVKKDFMLDFFGN